MFKKKKINNGKQHAVSKIFNVKKNKKIFLKKLEHIKDKKEETKKKKVFKLMQKIDLHPIGGLDKKIKKDENMNKAKRANKGKRAEKGNRKLEIRNWKLGLNTPLTPLKRGTKKSEWVILDSRNGEEFALRNGAVAASGDTAAYLRRGGENIDRSIIGLPEAGKHAPWNLIEVKEALKSGCENEKYILDDYDVLQNIENLNENLNYPVRSYNSSPYVVDLKNKKEDKNGIENTASNGWLKFKISNPFSGLGEKIIDFKELILKFLTVKFPAAVPMKNFSFFSVRILRDGYERVFAQDYLYSKILSFVLIAFLIVSPIYGLKQYLKVKEIQGKVLGASASAIDNLKLGKDLMQVNDFYAAKENFNKAEDDFKSAGGALEEINNLSYKIAFLVFNKGAEVKSAEALIEAGKKAAEASSILADSFKNISSSFDELTAKATARAVAFTDDGFHSLDETAVSDSKNNFSGRNFSNLVSDFHNILEITLPKIREIQEYLKIVDEGVVPAQDRENFNKVKNLVSFVDNKLNFYEDAVYVLDKFFAKNSFKRYLLVFQNNNEIRPTGGFIGSYSLADIEDGKIANIETPSDGSYYLEGSLLENIKPPQALRLINGRWEFQDANWWPDFPTSAKFISSIYEKSGGRTADGVIAINASVMADILKIIGPIEMKDYNKIFDSENFINETQKAVELEYDRRKNEPKKIIADLMPRIMEEMFSARKEKFLDILTVLNGNLQKRNIQFYFRDEDLEARTVKLGWAGEIKDVKNRDYLAIIDTNIGGKKTDGVISQKIEHNTNVSDDGTIIDELIIHKKHNGVKGDYFYGVNNVDYLRVYVPLGSILLSAEGFDAPPESCFKELEPNIIEDEFLAGTEAREKTDIGNGTKIGENFGKTYFANWTQVDPGEEITVKLSYKLPFKIFDSEIFYSSISGGEQIGKYSLYIQKQSGSRAQEIIKNIKLPENLTPIWAYPGTPENGEWVKFDKMDMDKFYGAIFTGE
ncbi:MAG: DUF4012 domain-containing protein [bacterium]